MTPDNKFLNQIIEECCKLIEKPSCINVMFGKILYYHNGKGENINAIEFRDLNLSILVTKENIMGILHQDGTFYSVDEPDGIKVQQALNKLFIVIEDTTEKSIEELTNGNFQYFDV